jgi:SAM-dependent methyltransferase
MQGGREAALELSEALRAADRSIDPVDSILDFGCGSARVLPHIAALAPEADCAGCDVDRSAIAWAERHRPELRWALSGFEPPLPFGAESFALVYSISVFSHIGEEAQDRWLEEIARVLQPGGVALLSVHGSYAFDQFRSGRVRSSWSRAGAFERGPLGPSEFVFEPYRRSIWNRSELPGVGGEYGLAFHGEGYLRDHWSGVFEISAVLERALTAWQDIVVCRRVG